MANVICFDFDGTIATENVAEALFERFAAPQWRKHRDAYRAGRETIEQYSAAALDLVGAPLEELVAHARSIAKVRGGFLELIDWAHWHGWLPIVVSNGFDFYVNAVLDDLRLDRVARHAGRARFDYRWRVTYLSPRGIELQAGYRLSYVAALHGAGDFVVYIGAGGNDAEATRKAHVVFVRDALLEPLSEQHPRLYAFDTFNDVVDVLDREAESWLASFSSMTAAVD
jgi:2-hydroxy-3-keto-5-methylthiopentenyl-1-phosphate phosphatase